MVYSSLGIVEEEVVELGKHLNIDDIKDFANNYNVSIEEAREGLSAYMLYSKRIEDGCTTREYKIGELVTGLNGRGYKILCRSEDRYTGVKLISYQELYDQLKSYTVKEEEFIREVSGIDMQINGIT